MPLKLNTEITMMDLIAVAFSIVTLVGGGTLFVTKYAPDIKRNETEIVTIKTSIERIERDADRSEDKILDMLKQQGVTINEIQDESAEGRQLIMDKLDRLIERRILSGP